MVFPHVTVSVFPFIVFPSAGFTPWSKNSYCVFFVECQLATTRFTWLLHVVFRGTIVSAKLEWCHGMCKAYSVFAGTDMESNHGINSIYREIAQEQWLMIGIPKTNPCWNIRGALVPPHFISTNLGPYPGLLQNEQPPSKTPNYEIKTQGPVAST